jgi:general secretion pathway protein B
MSFILDALKKSERERQRTAVPGISDLPMVVHSSRSLPWVAIGIGASLVGAAALAWVWWQSPPDLPLTTVATPSPLPTSDVVQPAPQPTRASAAPPATRSLASEAPRVVSARNLIQPNAASRPDEAMPAASSAPASQGRGTVTEAPMSILEARVAGLPVPELALELLVFSEDPRQRFVYINSTKYVEGETLSEGPRLIEISPDGAVLTFNGRIFMLPQN